MGGGVEDSLSGFVISGTAVQLELGDSVQLQDTVGVVSGC